MHIEEGSDYKMVPEDRRYVVLDCSELDSVDFAEVLENSSETVRKSIDETKTFVKYNGDMPDSVSALTTKTQEYNHSEILGILSGEDWVSEDPEGIV